MKDALYEGPDWKGGVEEEAMPMLEDYKFIKRRQRRTHLRSEICKTGQVEVTSRTGFI